MERCAITFMKNSNPDECFSCSLHDIVSKLPAVSETSRKNALAHHEFT